MVNRVILCGQLVEPICKGEASGKPVAFVRIRVVRYGRHWVYITGKLWGKTVDWAVKRNFQKGAIVQIIGSLSSVKSADGNYYLELSVDSMTEIEFLTEQLKDAPWDKLFKRDSSNQAS